MNREHWRSLELAATVAYYFGRTKGYSRDMAFAEAKKLKPETVPFVENAKKGFETLAI